MKLQQADCERLISRLENIGASPEPSAEEIAAIRREAARCLKDALQRIADLEREIADMQRAIERAAIETNVARDA